MTDAQFNKPPFVDRDTDQDGDTTFDRQTVQPDSDVTDLQAIPSHRVCYVIAD